MDWVGLLVFLPFIVVSVSLLIVASRLYTENKSNKALLEKALIEKEYALAQLSNALSDIENMKLQKDDSFIKFLTTSRDWAYEYIEKLQETLLTFDKKVSVDFKWNNGPGTVLGETVHHKLIKDIEKAYAPVKELLPDQPPPNKK